MRSYMAYGYMVTKVWPRRLSNNSDIQKIQSYVHQRHIVLEMLLYGMLV